MAKKIEILENTLLKLLVRRGSNADREDVILSEGELGYTTDTNRLFVGDGVTPGGKIVGNRFLGTSNSVTTFANANVGDLAYDADDRALYAYAGPDPATSINGWTLISSVTDEATSNIKISVGNLDEGANNIAGEGIVINNGRLAIDCAGINTNKIAPCTNVNGALELPNTIQYGNNAAYTYSIPARTGSAGKFLVGDNNGNLSWSSDINVGSVTYFSTAEQVIPVGAIVAFADLDAVESNWLICNGDEYDKTTYPDLFDIIGYDYGGNDPLFQVPDLRDKVLYGTEDKPTNVSDIEIGNGGDAGEGSGGGVMYETSNITGFTGTGDKTQQGPGIDEDNRWQKNTFEWKNITFDSLTTDNATIDDITSIRFVGGLRVNASGQGSYSTQVLEYQYSYDNGTTWERVLHKTERADFVRYATGYYPALEIDIPIPGGLKANGPIALRVKVSSDNTDNNERVRNYGELVSVIGTVPSSSGSIGNNASDIINIYGGEDGFGTTNSIPAGTYLIDVNWIQNAGSPSLDEDTVITVSQKFTISSGSYLHFGLDNNEGFYAITNSSTAPIEGSADWINVRTLPGFKGRAPQTQTLATINGFAIKLDNTSNSVQGNSAILNASFVQGNRPVAGVDVPAGDVALTTGYQIIDLNDVNSFKTGLTTNTVIVNNTGVFSNTNNISVQVSYAKQGQETTGGAIDQAICGIYKDNVNGDYTKIIVECSNSPINASGRYDAYFNINAVQYTESTANSTTGTAQATPTVYAIKAVTDPVVSSTLTVKSPLTASVDGVLQGENPFNSLEGDIEIGIGQSTISLDDIQMFNFRSKGSVLKGYIESNNSVNDIDTAHRGSLPITFDSDVKFVELKYTSSIANPNAVAQIIGFAEDSTNGTVYIDWENKKLKQSSLRKEGDANHYQHWYESAGEESDGIIMFNTPDTTPANSAEGIIINWSTRTITGLPAYNRTYSGGGADATLPPYEHQYIFRDLTNSGSFGSVGGGGGSSLLKYGEIQVGDIGTGTGSLATVGDFTATKSVFNVSGLSFASTINCVFNTPLPNTEYNVITEVVSLHTTDQILEFNEDPSPLIVFDKTINGFKIHSEDVYETTQNLQINVRIESNQANAVIADQKWEAVTDGTYDFDQASNLETSVYTNSTGSPLVIRGQFTYTDQEQSQGDDDVFVSCIITHAGETASVAIPFAAEVGFNDVSPLGGGYSVDVGSITIPAGATYKFTRNNDDYDRVRWYKMTTTAVVGSASGGTGGGGGSSLLKYGEIDAGNIGVVAPNPVTRGDFTTTVISNSTAGDTHDTTFECVFNTSLTNDNYSVMFEIISKGTDINKDNNLKTPVVFNKTATGFRFNVEEGAVSNIGNNQINIRVESNVPGTGGTGGTGGTPGPAALVNFDGGASGTTNTGPQTIHSSNNIASVVKTGNGQYTVTFSTPMSDAKYIMTGAAQKSFDTNRGFAVDFDPDFTPTTTECKIRTISIDSDPRPSSSPLITLAFFDVNASAGGTGGGLKDPNHAGGTINVTTSFQDLDLSSIVGSNKAQVTMEVYGGSTGVGTLFRTKGSVIERFVIGTSAGWGSSGVTPGPTDQGGVVTLTTDSNGVVQFNGAGTSTGVNYKVLTYQVIS